MASDQKFVDYVTDQMKDAGVITSRKMFGEYAVYCEGIVVALVCDNRLFVKATDGGRNFIGKPVEAPAYPGAKPGFLIEDQLEDRDWIGELVRVTYGELSVKKEVKKKKRKPAAPVKKTRKRR